MYSITTRGKYLGAVMGDTSGAKHGELIIRDCDLIIKVPNENVNSTTGALKRVVARKIQEYKTLQTSDNRAELEKYGIEIIK